MEHPIAAQLDNLLADFSVYYQKLRNYHWNVRGKRFFQLHEEFEELYRETAEWIDTIAERIVQLEERPTATLAGFVAKSRLEESPEPKFADEMVRDLVSDIDRLQLLTQNVIEAAEEEGDPATHNFLEDICEAQAKNRWMLSAWLAE